MDIIDQLLNKAPQSKNPENPDNQTNSNIHKKNINSNIQEHINNTENKITSPLSENSNTIEYKKKHIISKLKLINNDNYLKNIHELIKKHDIKHTINKNGIFFNLNALSKKQVNALYNHINNILKNIKKFKDDTTALQNIKNNINFTSKKRITKIRSIQINHNFNLVELDIIKFSLK